MQWPSSWSPLHRVYAPLNLIILEHLPLRVVADDFDVDEAAQIELLRSELCHDGLSCVPMELKCLHALHEEIVEGVD